MRLHFKYDIYKQNRGGYSRAVELSCRVCKNSFAVYQKDGPGNLRRLYLDRILYPKELTNLQNENIEDIENLTCDFCGEDIATPYIYNKENRKAFKVYQDMILKKIIKKDN